MKRSTSIFASSLAILMLLSLAACTSSARERRLESEKARETHRRSNQAEREMDRAVDEETR